MHGVVRSIRLHGCWGLSQGSGGAGAAVAREGRKVVLRRAVLRRDKERNFILSGCGIVKRVSRVVIL